MKHQILFSVIFSAFSLALSHPNASADQVRVVLFEQPCLLKGPFSKERLKEIHSVSPDQLPVLESQAKIDSSWKRVQSARDRLPIVLESYIELLSKHILALKAFYEGVELVRSTKDPTKFLERVDRSLVKKSDQKFKKRIEPLTKKLAKSGSSSETIETLRDVYLENVIAHPEEEFHRAIRKIKVQYHCSFDVQE